MHKRGNSLYLLLVVKKKSYGENVPFAPGLVAHSDLDERAIEALKEFNEDAALQVLVQFKESDLSHVQVSLCLLFLLR